ncbi:MAG TPA: glycosyltransferase [Vicinamibacterales bacterium]|nr:glycosyltransferase [Vicinamibacterales bacterium]
MILCDLSTFYCSKGGGVSTYHRARLDWFSRQRAHQYILVSPGPRFEMRQPAPSVIVVQVYGARASRDTDRYRLLIDYGTVRDVIQHFSPDVLETHDPWFSLPMGLIVRHKGPYRGLLTTYCHSDPIRTYVHPRLPSWRWLSRSLNRWERWADRELHRLHGACRAVFVASEVMRERLNEVGVDHVVKAGFGFDGDLLRIARRAPDGARRILYAGRLDTDKEFELVLDVLPDLLGRTDVHVTIAGAGKYARDVARIKHPRFRYLGHIVDRRALCVVYASHDVLLAPGRFETFGMSALEGAAAGLIVVGPSEGGTGELLKQCHSPLMFTPGCRTSFRNAIDDSIRMDRAPLVERGRALARQHGSWDSSVARHVAIYLSMLGRESDELVGHTA